MKMMSTRKLIRNSENFGASIFQRKIELIIFAIFLVVLLPNASADNMNLQGKFIAPTPLVSDNSCTLGIKDETKGMHIVVETCKNIGTFSIGGLYNGNWEKLTYFYPSPWEGTFLSVKVNDNVYSNSENPDEKIQMDTYIIEYPSVSGNKISTKWMLPENPKNSFGIFGPNQTKSDLGILVEQTLEITKDAVLIHIKTTNADSNPANVGVRLHIDTMLGDNDGAPIYIPGDGLKTSETGYSAHILNFKYWKAYNRQDDPTIIATGILDGRLTYPDKVLIANWKKSFHSSWDYEITPDVLITGDSAVILYYPEKPLFPNSAREITTAYGIGSPILPALISFGIADIVTDKITGLYCPGEVAELGVDVANTGKNAETGLVSIRIEDNKGFVIYGNSKDTGIMNPDSVNSIKFDWLIPENLSGSFVVRAQLFRNTPIDEKILVVTVDPSQCISEKKEINPVFLAILAVLLAAIILFLIYSRRGGIEIKKIREGNTVKVTVLNKSKKEIRNCIIDDKIPGNAEIHVRTIGVQRTGDKLIMNVGRLKPGEVAILEYRVKGINVLPRAIVRWAGGEKASD